MLSTHKCKNRAQISPLVFILRDAVAHSEDNKRQGHGPGNSCSDWGDETLIMDGPVAERSRGIRGLCSASVCVVSIVMVGLNVRSPSTTVQATIEQAWTFSINTASAHMQSESVAVHVESLSPFARQSAWSHVRCVLTLVLQGPYRTVRRRLCPNGSSKCRQGKCRPCC